MATSETAIGDGWYERGGTGFGPVKTGERALDCAMCLGASPGGHVTGWVGPLSDAAAGA